jgi:hypothetical protein
MDDDFDVDQTIFVSGLEFVEMLGGNAGYVFYRDETRGLHVLAKRRPLRLIMPNNAAPDAAAKVGMVPGTHDAVRRLFPMWKH